MFVAALLAQTLAFAPVADGEAFQRAVADYQALDFERAALSFQAVPQEGLGDDEIALLLLWQGVCFGQMGDAERARGYFARALLRDADARLPVEVPPALDALFDEVEREMAERAPEPIPWSGIAWIAGGSVAATAAVVFASASGIFLGQAADPTTPPRPATEALDAANLNLALSVGSVIVAACAFTTGVLVLNPPSEEGSGTGP